jgi:hypothetical protein
MQWFTNTEQVRRHLDCLAWTNYSHTGFEMLPLHPVNKRDFCIGINLTQNAQTDVKTCHSITPFFLQLYEGWLAFGTYRVWVAEK